MKLVYRLYELQLRHAFNLASSSREYTPVVLVEIHHDGLIGYGEASLPPYLAETQKSVADFLRRVNLEQFKDPCQLDDILTYVDGIAQGNYAAKASVDIALHDLIGKIKQKSWYNIWGYRKEDAPNTSFTIGIDCPGKIRKKVNEANQFKLLKVKLGGGNDKEMLAAIRDITDVALSVDVNQGWSDRYQALDMVHWLKEQGVIFIEQPMLKEDIESAAWLTERSPLPIIADEAVQTLFDVPALAGVYSGINIKLMKCGGMSNAHKMIQQARALNMTVMIGCMTETSCGTSAAAQLSPAVDWADLDGNLLICNDLFEGVTVKNGKVILPDAPGIGVKKIS
ncbi:dipeptide epimerase [Puteibacter caeruleilacunae]|nr:dipeptide epimerase [Puteibacter caeruleilacunae]